VQLFNQINARKIGDELNVFSGIIHSHLFIYIWIVEAGLQVLELSTAHSRPAEAILLNNAVSALPCSFLYIKDTQDVCL